MPFAPLLLVAALRRAQSRSSRSPRVPLISDLDIPRHHLRLPIEPQGRVSNGVLSWGDNLKRRIPTVH